MSEPDGATLDASTRRLYQVRPDGFVAARDQLAKELKANGDRSASDAVKRLKRPAVTAWAVDRLAADDPSALDELFAANERLRDAMAASGKDTRERFRAASEERQRIVARLTERAGSVLEDAGLPSGRSNLDRIAATLMGTATDEAGAALLREGVLDHDLTAGGDFGGIFASSAPEATTSRPEPAAAAGKRRQADVRKRESEEHRRRERAEREATERAAEAKDADRIASDAERVADDAEREAERVTRIATARRREADRTRRDADRAAELARTALERLTASPDA